jgi:tetratricopeptide (TPR) repeat protein
MKRFRSIVPFDRLPSNVTMNFINIRLRNIRLGVLIVCFSQFSTSQFSMSQGFIQNPTGTTICDMPRYRGSADYQRYCVAPQQQYVDPRIGTANGLNEQGRQALSDSKYDDAANYFEQAYAMYPQDVYRTNLNLAYAGQHFKLGSDAFHNRKWQLAIDEYQRALSLRPDDGAAADNIDHARSKQSWDAGIDAFNNKQYDLAIRYYQQGEAFRHDPEFANLIREAKGRKIGIALQQGITRNEIESANRAAQAALRENPGDPDAAKLAQSTQEQVDRAVETSSTLETIKASARATTGKDWLAMKQAALALIMTPPESKLPSRCPWDTDCNVSNGNIQVPGKPQSDRFLPPSRETPEQRDLHSKIEIQQEKITSIVGKLIISDDPIERHEIKQIIPSLRSDTEKAQRKYDEITATHEIKKRPQ